LKWSCLFIFDGRDVVGENMNLLFILLPNFEIGDLKTRFLKLFFIFFSNRLSFFFRNLFSKQQVKQQ